MKYLIEYPLLIIICIVEIIFSQSIYNKELYGDRESIEKSLNNRGNEIGWSNYEALENSLAIIEETISYDQYVVGPGDQFAVYIISSDGVFNDILEITPTGELLLPLVGLIEVDQLSLKSAIDKIRKVCKDKYENIKLEITLIKLRNFKIHITGAVKKSGYVVISSIDRLSAVIKKSKGFIPLSKEYNIMITSKDGAKKYVNYLDFLRTGNISQNPIIKNGDWINVPFGDIRNESVQIKGAVERSGYDIIEPEETFWQFMQRSISFIKNSSLEKIIIIRGDNGEEIEIFSQEFKEFILLPGDQIYIVEGLAIYVSGFVNNPGRYEYFPEFSVADYLGLAGGHIQSGNMPKVQIQRISGNILIGLDNEIKRGDIIYVPERMQSKLVGDLSLLQITSYLASIILTYIAATQ